MKRLIFTLAWLLSACSESGPSIPTIPEVDVSTLEVPVAQAIGETVEELQGFPENSQYWANYAEVLQAHQLYQVARIAWAVRLGSGEVTPGDLILMLRCQEALGQEIEGLEQAVESTLLEQPNLTSLRFSRGSNRLRSGDLEGAQEDLEVALSQDRHPAILLALGRAELSLGEIQRAKNLLEEARALAPGDADIQKTLAPVYLQLGAPELADVERQRVLRGRRALRFDASEVRMAQRAVSSSANTDRAREAMARREWKVALVWLNKIIDVHPDRASAHARRGICYLMTNQLQKADQDFRKAIAEDESLAMAHRGLGVLAGRGGRPEEAVTHLARAIDLNPEDPDALGMYPIALLKAGQISEAEGAYETARARFPKNRILVQQWLVGLRSMGRADQGLAAARSALQDLGEDAAVLHHAALCLEALGQVQEAMEYHRRSAAADPKSPSASRLRKSGAPS
ncbi:MAG: hypothetical protein CMJ37_01545 [Phycisphaerae bacterium]|nr:hypothetical protein [Phycisphaerae bacterium]